ncbi:AcrR family transcriptional regulator [Streptomyces sp. LBL]|uniref:TetR/AcrR family transcriptional regulator n=1 Tax=Streptomyces sp. LBL TaxID=2940562 RepID=UPI0024752F9D|nr:helix-turn-helix domain-containing protein [Streptomyces sp. LBL]MDH6629844.1 AcrR family transcriptional regulator [Streptomyces sp. LBL]
MARVSQEHLDARRRQILDGAARCFARSGFHATSMQDVLDEVGLSNGAFYRYFRSKDELIAAIATDVFTFTRLTFENAAQADPLPPDVLLGRILHGVYDSRLSAAHPDRQGLPRLVVQVWAETLRNPKLLALLGDGDDGMRAAWARLIQAYQEQGRIHTDVSADQIARTLIVVGRGFALENAMFGDFEVDDLITGLRGLMAMVAVEDGQVARRA